MNARTTIEVTIKIGGVSVSWDLPAEITPCRDVLVGEEEAIPRCLLNDEGIREEVEAEYWSHIMAKCDEERERREIEATDRPFYQGDLWR